MNRSVLVIAAHADDEVLGCAGSIARHVAEGDLVHVVFMADGVTARPDAGASEHLKRFSAAEKAQANLGVKSIIQLGFADNRMDGIPLLDIVQRIESVIAELCPDLVYTHHSGDLNVDHRVTHHAVMTACRPLPGAIVREIRCFEILSSTEWTTTGLAQFQPNLFVDISSYLEKKLAAAAAYFEEMRAVPHSRSLAHVEVLARHRGYSVGVEAAEAFMIARSIY
jgi:LmbE family N-acetylglucosaminyl deacetylase